MKEKRSGKWVPMGSLRIILIVLLLASFTGTGYVVYNHYFPKPSPKSVIGIIPFENFPLHYTRQAKQQLETYYGLKVHILPAKPLPLSSYTHHIPELKKFKPQKRYRADTLIRYLRRIKPDSIDYLVGLTSKDISITKNKDPEWKYRDFGIFGLGFRPGVSCVVSTYRLRSGHVSEKVFLNRFVKITTHEAGHMFGLKHCDSRDCVMASAQEKISTVDSRKAILCEKCKRSIF